MPKYNPFAERAGMQIITMKDPPNQVKEVAALLESLGFDLRLISSQNYTMGKLGALKD